MNKHPKIFIAVIAFLLYSPTLFFEYVYMDDYLMVQETPFYSKIENIPKSFTRSIWHPTGEGYNYYRPLSTSTYILGAWISTMLHNDIKPWIFHLTNVLLQMGVAVLLHSLFLALGASARAARFAPLILILHPASAGTLGWIPGQNELLLAVCVVGGFLAYIRGLQKPRWFLLHGLFFLLGALTKENVAGLPILCAMYLLLSPKRRDYKLWFFSVLTWGSALGIWVMMASQGGGGSPPEAGSALTSMFHGLPYILIYLGQLMLPIGLSTIPTPMDAYMHFWIAGAAGALAAFGVAFWRTRARPVVWIGVCWFGGFLLPTFANMIPETKLSFILRSDRAYLASIGLLIIFMQIPEEKWRAFFGSRTSRIGLALVTIAILALNVRHQLNFSTGMAFYRSGIEGSPRSSFAHTHLGDMYLYIKDVPGAIEQYKRAIELNYYEPQAHNNLGVAYMRANQMDLAAEEYRKELEFNPKNLLTWSNLGSIYLQRGDHASAEHAFRKAVEINPAYKDAWLGLYKIYNFQNRADKRDEAKRFLEAAEIDMSKGI